MSTVTPTVAERLAELVAFVRSNLRAQVFAEAGREMDRSCRKAEQMLRLVAEQVGADTTRPISLLRRMQVQLAAGWGGLREVSPRHMSRESAAVLCLLAWILFDRECDSVQPSLCEIQHLPWSARSRCADWLWENGMAEKALDALAIVKASGPSSESPPSPDLPPAAAGALAEVPLTAPERKLLQILYALPPDKALMGEELTAKGLPAQSDLTSRLIGSAANGKGLRGKGWNIPNRARVGYYLSEQDRARYERMQQMARNSAGT